MTPCATVPMWMPTLMCRSRPVRSRKSRRTSCSTQVGNTHRERLRSAILLAAHQHRHGDLERSVELHTDRQRCLTRDDGRDTRRVVLRAATSRIKETPGDDVSIADRLELPQAALFNDVVKGAAERGRKTGLLRT